MTQAEISANIRESENIMKHGHLIAISSSDAPRDMTGWQYWVYNGVLYSISSRNHVYSIWCGVDKLRAHCRYLERVIGHKYFDDSDRMCVLDKDFVAKYC